MTMTRKLLLLSLALAPMALSAQTIYKCTDTGGGVLISNSRVNKNCQAIVNEEHSAPAAPRAASRASANPTPAGFPRVQEDTQKARDSDRRLILEQELAGEQRKLEQARKELAEQEAVRGGNSAERTAPYRDRVAVHERNLQAIQKELSGLR